LSGAKVLLTGATGFLGQRLSARLRTAGASVYAVSRGRGADFDWSDASLARGVETCDFVVHLAGENVFAQRWTPRFKAELVRSRVATGTRLAELVARRGSRAFVSASAVGFYRTGDARDVDESAPRGDGFLAELCERWEGACEPARRAGVRTANVRIGMLLGAEGGALKKLARLFRFGLGGRVASGEQWMPWVHADDTSALFEWILANNSASGIYNATSPNPVTNAEFTRALARAVHRPALFPLPAFAAKLALGEAADVLTTGVHAVPRRALEQGFQFRFTDLDAALADLLSRRT
jgi:hypothetical protein